MRTTKHIHILTPYPSWYYEDRPTRQMTQSVSWWQYDDELELLPEFREEEKDTERIE